MNMENFLKKKRPTVVAAKKCDPEEDVNQLKNALKGFLADDKTLIQILAYRSNHQRQEIKIVYKTKLGRDLIADIKSVIKGNLANLLIAMLMPMDEFLAKQIHDAITGLGTDETALIECLCGLNNNEIAGINQKYIETYDCTLEEDIACDTSGSFRRLLISLLNGGRDESQTIDRDAALKDVVKLLNAGELVMGSDAAVFSEILCTRNFPQIRQINIEYNNLIGHTLIDAVDEVFTGDLKNGYQAIVQFATDSHTFYANRLYQSMVGLGTNDAALIRLIVWRSEIDLENIKEIFECIYGKSLKSWIKGDTSGNYRRCLYALIGETTE